MINLKKVHGSQNSFFILDQTLLTTPLTEQELVTLTKTLTAKATGILGGADGILVVQKSSTPNTVAQMRVINADGSEASMCGNGLRTVARYLAEKHALTSFKVQTRQSDLEVQKQAELAPNVPAFGVEISPVHFEKRYLPFDNLGAEQIIDRPLVEFEPQKKLHFTIMAVPNPHLISFVPDIEKAGTFLGELGAKLNTLNPYFPDGVNVNFAQILGPNKLFVRTYERGVGFTNACGTGMSATSLAFYLSHPEQCDLTQEITVFNPGGMVKTKVRQLDDQFKIQLIGNATFSHDILVAEKHLHHNTVTPDVCQIQATGEQEAYLKFIQHLNA